MRAEITRFLRRAHMTEEAFGALVMNNVRLMHQLREGRKLDAEAINRIRLFIQNYWEAKR